MHQFVSTWDGRPT